jgi:hypothetical protein
VCLLTDNKVENFGEIELPLHVARDLGHIRRGAHELGRSLHASQRGLCMDVWRGADVVEFAVEIAMNSLQSWKGGGLRERAQQAAETHGDRQRNVGVSEGFRDLGS